MSTPYADEEAPLLGEFQSPTIPATPHRGAAFDRVHWVDNLRAVLTVLLIFHHASVHAALESLSAFRFHAKTLIPLALFITTNKVLLYGLFFFVSGYSTYLGLRAKSDLAFLWSRVVKLGLPVFLYAYVGGHRVLARIARDSIARRPWWHTSYQVTEGPAGYVVSLLLLDAIYLSTRQIGRHWPAYSFSRLEAYVKDSRRAINALFALSVLLITGITIGNCFGLELVPWFVHHDPKSFEFPGFGTPVTHIVAYIAGVNFPLVQRYVLPSRPWRAVGLLFVAAVIAHATLGITQHFSTPMRVFIRAGMDSEGARHFVQPGFNAQTIIFSLWNPFVFHALSIGVISTFICVPGLGRDWGMLTKHTYTQTFVHMVPVVILAHLLDRWPFTRDPAVKAVLTGLVGVVVSWGLGVGVWKVKENVVKRMGWKLPVDVNVRARYAEEVPLVGGGDEGDLLGN